MKNKPTIKNMKLEEFINKKNKKITFCPGPGSLSKENSNFIHGDINDWSILFIRLGNFLSIL